MFILYICFMFTLNRIERWFLEFAIGSIESTSVEKKKNDVVILCVLLLLYLIMRLFFFLVLRSLGGMFNEAVITPISVVEYMNN